MFHKLRKTQANPWFTDGLCGGSAHVWLHQYASGACAPAGLRFHHQRERRDWHLFFRCLRHASPYWIVFSMTFVMVQFSATAYSPRLVL